MGSADAKEAKQAIERGGMGVEQSEHTVLGHWVHFRVHG